MNCQIVFPVFSFWIILLSSYSKDSGRSSLPVAAIFSASAERGSSGSSVSFPILLSANTTSDVAIHYATVDGTAEANKDYVPVTGTLIIPAGSQSGTIKVDITADSLRREDQYFSLQLSDP